VLNVLRLLEVGVAFVGGCVCIFIPTLTIPAGEWGLPFPGLYLIEIWFVGLLMFVYSYDVSLFVRKQTGWIPWMSAGIILAFILFGLLGSFPIDLYLLPAPIAFVMVGLLVDWQAGGLVVLRLGVLLVAAVAQAAVMAVVTLIA
jgi:hypothetical protein